MTTRELFLPCRRGSQRVPDKNTRPFAGHAGGLLGVKLDQLEATRGFDRIVVDSNDPEVLERADARRARWSGHGALVVRERPDALGLGTTTTDALVAWALANVDADELAWTHVTSPFCGSAAYERLLAAWLSADREAHDSLMAVHPIRSFVWSAAGALNYRVGAGDLRWPRTQDVTPVFDVCSALFIVPVAVGRTLGDRIGGRPLLAELGRLDAFDIDWDEDFAMAEALWPRLGVPR
ncbi:MAG: acylneuraminate cytidylyltransferase family protein [Deltaproteobacteria bacterium]|nr:acylneuraminate cytidylyltransferase family protein [Deltaproteobacteria bacterium]